VRLPYGVRRPGVALIVEYPLIGMPDYHSDAGPSHSICSPFECRCPKLPDSNVVVPNYQKLPATVSVLFPDRSGSPRLILGEQFSVDPVDVPPGLSSRDALAPPALAVVSIAPADLIIILQHEDVRTIR